MIACSLGLLAPLASAASVVFLNPGFVDEPFWQSYTRFMQKAASDLGLSLEVVYGERNHHLMLERAEAVRRRAQLPDYLLFTNENHLGPEFLRRFEHSGVRLLAIHSSLTAAQQAIAGGPRQKYRNWIGSLEVNDEEAGYLMARELFANAPAGSELLAFSGLKTTPSAIRREAGLYRALAERPDIRLRQLVNGEWQQQRAYQQVRGLLRRYPQVELIWSANDEMTFGVMRAATEQQRTLRYTALNNSREAFRARRNGPVVALASGHFMLGGCALVMLHDYHQRRDFAEQGGVAQQLQLFRLIDAEQTLILERRLAEARPALDFRRFSNARPAHQRQPCNIDSLLRDGR